jgi:hypothetical protein
MRQRCVSISFVDVSKTVLLYKTVLLEKTFVLSCLVSKERTRKLVEQLRKWASRQHGRQQEVANALSVHKSVVSNWLAFRQELTGEQALALHEFLGEARRSEAFFWGMWDDQ